MEASVAEPIEILRRTPEVLRALLNGLPETWTDILEDGTTKAFDRFDRHAMLDRDTGVPLEALVERFAELRAQNLAEFESMVTDGELDRRGMHPSLGEVTLDHLLNTWAVHDLDHMGQILAGLAGSHDDDVGPWKNYLGILLRREDPAAVPG